MNEQIRRKLARDAWLIYKQAIDMEKHLLKIFIDDFIDFDEEERKLVIAQNDLPF